MITNATRGNAAEALSVHRRRHVVELSGPSVRCGAAALADLRHVARSARPERAEREPPIPPAERSRSADGFPDAPVEQRERRDDDVWLPEPIGEGWSDSWKRFDPFAAYASSDLPPAMPVGLLSNLKFLAGFLDGILGSAIEWRDRTSFRLPHVRNRVARLMLRKGEGGLNIGMQRKQILQMAHRYGTKTRAWPSSSVSPTTRDKRRARGRSSDGCEWCCWFAACASG